MREIKFRAWEKNLHEIIRVDNIDFKNNLINIDGAWRIIGVDVELMQYTGLTDKNGVEVFEGDIILLPTLTKAYPVVIEPLGVGLRDKDNKWQGQLYHRTSEMEVIGNIYENPKLLEHSK